jgi:transforming growth factor-beta-induced protein
VAVTVEGSTVRVGGATVIQADVAASNGVVHVIDTVLLPPNP